MMQVLGMQWRAVDGASSDFTSYTSCEGHVGALALLVKFLPMQVSLSDQVAGLVSSAPG